MAMSSAPRSDPAWPISAKPFHCLERWSSTSNSSHQHPVTRIVCSPRRDPPLIVSNLNFVNMTNFGHIGRQHLHCFLRREVGARSTPSRWKPRRGLPIGSSRIGGTMKPSTYESSIKVHRSVFGETDDRVLLARQRLILAYARVGRLVEASALGEHLVDSLRKSPKGLGHNQDLLRVQNLLAGVYMEAGRLSESVGLLEHVLRLRKSLRAQLARTGDPVGPCQAVFEDWQDARRN